MKNINGLNEIEQQVLFIDDVEKIIGRNRLTLRRWWMDGKFPLPVKLNGTTLAWHREAVAEWIERNVKSFFSAVR
jgi:prophage regulatory protein